jgi:hypothetical protein
MTMSEGKLKSLVRVLRDLQPGGPSREQYVDWAYGQTALENPSVTREMAETAVDKVLAER